MIEIGIDGVVPILWWVFMNYEQQRRMERLERELDEAQSAIIQAKLRALQLEGSLRTLRAKGEYQDHAALTARVEALEGQVHIEKDLRRVAERRLAEMETRRTKNSVSGLDRKFLQEVRRLTHPDRHGGSAAAHRVTSEINRRLR